jgi:hypothetical protein
MPRRWDGKHRDFGAAADRRFPQSHQAIIARRRPVGGDGAMSHALCDIIFQSLPGSIACPLTGRLRMSPSSAVRLRDSRSCAAALSIPAWRSCQTAAPGSAICARKTTSRSGSESSECGAGGSKPDMPGFPARPPMPAVQPASAQSRGDVGAVESGVDEQPDVGLHAPHLETEPRHPEIQLGEFGHFS